MTGRYPWKHRQNTNLNLNPVGEIECAVQKSLVFLPEYLNAAGYKSYMVGKWHLGHYSTIFTPVLRGFEEFVGIYSGGTNAINNTELTGYQEGIFRGPLFGPKILELVNDTKKFIGLGDEDAINSAEYHDFLLADEAIRMIRGHNSKDPFFLYLSWLSAHNPIIAPPRFVKKNAKLKDPCRQRFGGMLSALDQALNKVINAIKRKKGAWANTIFVFSSDNGGMSGKPPWKCRSDHAHNSIGSNYPLRGSKFNFWEGGIRTRAFIYSPKTSIIPQSVRGKTYDRLFSMTDWLATLLGFAGIKEGFNTLNHLDSIDHSGSISRSKTAKETPRARLDLQILKGGRSQSYVGFKYVNNQLFKYLRGYPGERAFLNRVTNRIEPPAEGVPPSDDVNTLKEYNDHTCRGGCIFQIEEDEGEDFNLLAKGNKTYAGLRRTWDNEIKKIRKRGLIREKLCKSRSKSTGKQAKARARLCGYAVPWLNPNFKRLPTK